MPFSLILKTPKITYKSGKVIYNVEGSTVEGLVVPGQNLISTPIDFNNSTVDSQLRIKLIITLNGEVLAYNDARIVADITLGSPFELVGEYYYYGGVNGKLLSTNTAPITIMSSLVLDGNYVKNSYASKSVNIKFILEAKQADHVTWQTLGEENIDFTIGY